jgi:YrbI family 3-deoxy-D-manno-octulosonate 8-phosphate phosphatase
MPPDVTATTTTGTCVVIPARGGSKGIPGKNLRRVGGVPLLARTINAARAARTVDHVVVSTDDLMIARVARRYGALVIERPSDLSGDTASSESAVLHALDVLESDGIVPEVVVLMQCTSPFTIADDVDRTVTAVRHGADTAFTAVPTHAFIWTEHDGVAMGVNHEATTRLRRQDRPAEYRENGAVYAMRAERFRQVRHRFFGTIAIVATDAARSIEIDDPDELSLARRLASLFDHDRSTGPLPDVVQALVLDFDGVFTDDSVLTFEDGTEAVVASRRDGMGLSLLRTAAPRLPIVVLSSETNRVVQARCRKLGIAAIQGLVDKETTLRSWCADNDVELSGVVYVGNDVNDIGCMTAVGCAVAPRDAHPAAIDAADLVLTARGGRGAIRELTEVLIDRVAPSEIDFPKETVRT